MCNFIFRKSQLFLFYLLLITVHSYGSPFCSVTSNWKSYNESPSITEQKPILEEAKKVIDYIKNLPNGIETLNKLEEEGIGFFAIHRHSKLKKNCIIVEEKRRTKQNKMQFITEMKGLDSLEDVAVHPASWTSSDDGCAIPFEYSTENASNTPLKHEELINFVIKCIYDEGLEKSIGVCLIEKKGYSLKDDEIFIEINFASIDEPENVISIIEAMAKSNTKAKVSIATAVRVTLEESLGCITTQECETCPNGIHHDVCLYHSTDYIPEEL